MANKNFDHVSHIKSKLTREVLPEEFYGLTPTADNSDAEGSSPVKLNLAKRPTAQNLIDGEIAVNYKKGHETLTIKNDADEIVGFVNENDFNQAQQIVALGLGQEKNERIEDISRIDQSISEMNEKIENIGSDIEERVDVLRNDVDDMELTISASLNDLNSRIIANANAIDGKADKTDSYSKDELDSILADKADITYVDESISNITETVTDMELTISASLNDLNSRIIANKDDADSKFTQINNNITTINSGMETVFNGATYDSDTKKIQFKNGDNVVAEIDATAFVKDGMVDSVAISNGNLVITFNTDAGKQDISIPLTDIFNPSNYYDKTAVDGLLSAKADKATTYTKTEVDDLLNGKADASSLTDYVTKTELEEVTSNLEDMELVVSSSLNDLNSRMLSNDSDIEYLRQENTSLRELITDLTARVAALENPNP